MRINRGDTVTMLRGKDAGRRGRVVKVLPSASAVVVEGVNVFKKHMKGDGRDKQSGIIDVAKPVHISNVKVICPACSKPTRIRYEVKGAKKTRVCKKCGKPFEKIELVGSSAEKTEKAAEKKKPVVKKKTVRKTAASTSASKKTMTPAKKKPATKRSTTKK